MKLPSLLLRGKKQRKIAHIDCIAADSIKGWVFDKRRPEYKPTLEIRCKGQVLGVGEANQSRDDLKHNGFGDGAHGFSIRLNIPADLDIEVPVHLYDKATGKLIQANECSIGGEYSVAAEIVRISSSGIAGTLNALGSQLPKDCVVCVFMDNEFVASAKAVVSNQCTSATFEIPLPSHAYNNQQHRFSVSVAGLNTQCKPYVCGVPTSMAISGNIASTSRQRGYASQSPLALMRYESLRAALAAIHSCEDAKNIHNAHDLLVEGARDRSELTPLRLGVSDNPVVSVVIPVFNQFSTTLHCLASIIVAADKTPFEVIVVDDASTDRTGDLEHYVENIKVVRNSENKGFIRSCNAGANQATGQYLLFLNNDTEVTAGWMEELILAMQQHDKIGAVGSRLLYSDGVLQDAGGIVWDSGVPWNVGNRCAADDPRFNYLRDVDYLTGAALLVCKSAWQQLNGFDEAFVPAYYEDTDLAFRLRELGYRTVYCPQSTVVHYEGVSNGTDIDSGVKKYQQINGEKFRDRWCDRFTGLGEEGENLHLMKDRNISLRILMIDHGFPNEGVDAGSYAAIQEIKLLSALGAKVTFMPENLLYSPAVTALQRLGVECVYAPYTVDCESFIAERGSEFDAFYITRYYVAEKVLPAIRTHSVAPVLFNNADLHFLREMRAAQSAGNTDLSAALLTQQREVQVMKAVDAVLSYNETEHDIIATHTKRSDNIFRCPWVLSSSLTEAAFEERSGIAFLGGYGHPPNREAIEYFVDKVIPRLLVQWPDAKFHIYGSGIPAEVARGLENSVVVEGFVDDLADLFNRHRVFVAPLLSGAGIKGKVLDSMAYGLPCVLSPVAAEATGLVDNVSMLLADSEEQWANQIMRLNSDYALWNRIRNAAHELVLSRYSKESGITQISAVFDYLGLAHNGVVDAQRFNKEAA